MLESDGTLVTQPGARECLATQLPPLLAWCTALMQECMLVLASMISEPMILLQYRCVLTEDPDIKRLAAG